MKSIFIITIFILFYPLAHSQWVEHLIPQVESPFPSVENTVSLNDLDGDGLLDIIYAYQSQGHWWRKNLGNGIFEPQALIINPRAGEAARYFDAGDINNNGITDLVVSYFSTNGGIYWHENDGQGTFDAGTPLQIPSGAGSNFTKMADIDNDGKLDVVVSFSFNNQTPRVMWFKNLGNGVFNTGTNIIQSGHFVQEFEIGDIDGDGDLDVVIGTTTLNQLSWFENLDGQGTFSAPKPIGTPNTSVLRHQLGDINGDGYLDVIADFGINDDRNLVWFENLDGQGTFSEARTIVGAISSNTSFSLVDIDNDGDNDLFFRDLDNFYWIENLDGLGNFGELMPIGTAVQYPHPIDINNDGYLDVLLACGMPRHFCWYENRVLSAPSFTTLKATAAPNPVLDQIHIASNLPIDNVAIFTSLGQKWSLVGSQQLQQTLSLEHLSTGLYFVSIQSGSQKQVIKVVKN